LSHSPERRKRTRDRIRAMAARLFKSNGYGSTTIDALMAEAGLTRGGFYAHFSGKEDLFADIIQSSFDRLPDEPDPLRKVFTWYMSQEHRDYPAAGCPLPTLAQDVARLRGEPQQRYRHIFRNFTRLISGNVKGRTRHDREAAATAIVAMMIGGMVVSRALGKTACSDEVLDACRETCISLADSAPSLAEPDDE